jgi:Kef-type K+ transport system membrane component KefB
VEHGGIINDMAICIVVAWLLAVGAQWLKQPVILAYIVGGFLIGPEMFRLITNPDSLDTISTLGLILLMYMIGLEIDLKKVAGAGRVITLTAVVQIVGGCLLGLLFFNFTFPLTGGNLDPLYMAVAVTLSSTVIIVKLLYDKREMDTLPGRLTVGILVVQDIFAILFLALQPNLNDPKLGLLAASLGKVALLVALAFVASRFALPPIFRSVAQLPELVVVGALAWCLMVAGIASRMHLSPALGALVAGVGISTFPYTLDVAAKVTSLRDFFVTLFFVTLGMTIPKPTTYFLAWSLFLCAFVWASRFATVFVPLHRMKLGHRASLLPTIYLAQVSEFSLVIMALGLESRQVSPNAHGVVAYAFVILAVVTTYLMPRSDELMKRASLMLSDANVPDLSEDTRFLTRPEKNPKIFLLGFAWTASSLIEEIRRHSPDWLNELAVIDFNPHATEGLRQRGIHVRYGDISQRDTLVHAGVGEAEIILCTLPNTVLRGTSNHRLLLQLREINPKATIIMQAELLSNVPKLYAAGADYVQVTRRLEAIELRSIIQAIRDRMLWQKKEDQDRELANRDEVIP